MKPRQFVIVGAGVAGHNCALELRRCGFEGRIVLVGSESCAPYDRTLLSKEFLLGRVTPADLALSPPAEYEVQGIELRLGIPAVALAPDRHELTLADGRTLAYDRLVIATGGAPIRPVDLCQSGARVLRTLADAQALRALPNYRHLVVIGGGFVGAEVAASARLLGVEVTIVETLPAPLVRAVGTEVGERIAELHRSHGVRLRTSTAACAIRRTRDGRFRVALSDGSVLVSDEVVVGAGMVPAADWLQGSRVHFDRGIITDALCRTSAPDVYAAGDCTRWYHRVYEELVHVEHWDVAARHGAAAARAALGDGEPFTPIPFFWSFQYGVRFQWVGAPFGWDAVQIEDDDSPRSFVARYLRGDRLMALFAAGDPRAVVMARRELQSTEEVYS
jgi:NADPH-dependent 2,4-dienoyl-CoA reductase/sulfur reductase-like enzyme